MDSGLNNKEDAPVVKQNYGMDKSEIAELLKGLEINPTAQRLDIAQLLLQEPQHLSADEIFQRINLEDERVSQATVYNTIRLFADKGLIRELILSADRIYYDSNLEPHNHFVDENTGEIIDLPNELPVCTAAEKLNAEISDVSIIVRGRLRAS